MTPTLNIASYKFIQLDDVNTLSEDFLAQTAALKGTILLSHEGINLNLAGTVPNITTFKQVLKDDMRFADMRFLESYSDKPPFQHLKIKIKKEIITMKQPSIDATLARAASLEPAELKKWLDEKRDITLLDTRNDYEVQFGTFSGAVNLHIDHFSKLPFTLDALDKEKPLVMFCTGGIRCEKAALHLMDQGFSSVYQLEGGILNYFAKVGGTHYEGSCFVFDERVALDAELKSVG